MPFHLSKDDTYCVRVAANRRQHRHYYDFLIPTYLKKALQKIRMAEERGASPDTLEAMRRGVRGSLVKEVKRDVAEDSRRRRRTRLLALYKLGLTEAEARFLGLKLERRSPRKGLRPRKKEVNRCSLLFLLVPPVPSPISSCCLL